MAKINPNPFKQNPLDLHIGNRLKAFRIESGISQDEVGELIGVTFQQIQKYESGLNRISASKLYEISQILNKRISLFFDDYLPDRDFHNFDFMEEKDFDLEDNIKAQESAKIAEAFDKIKNPEVKQSILTLLFFAAEKQASR